MKIQDLIDLVPGLTARQVRYLVAEGFVPPPRGGRARASYGDDHLAAIRRYQSLREAGLPPSAVKVVMACDAGVPVPLVPGVALLLDAQAFDPSITPEQVADRARAIIDTFLKEIRDAGSESDGES